MKPEDYDTLDDKDGIVKGIHEECARVREGWKGGCMPDYEEIAVKTALGFRPIRTAQAMRQYGQTVYNCVARCLRFYSQPLSIVGEIEKQTRIRLIRVKEAHWRLYPGHPGYIYSTSGYPLRQKKVCSFSAAHYDEKRKVEMFWKVTALAIAYHNNWDMYWLVGKLVNESFPTKCCACEGRLGRESKVELLPSDTMDWQQLHEAAENNQLKLRSFCSWKCQPSDRSAQWHLKQLERPRKKLRKFQENIQREHAVWSNALLRRCLEWTDRATCAFPLCARGNAENQWNLCRYHKAQLNQVLRSRHIARDTILKENL
jgi:hypothetical protein